MPQHDGRKKRISRPLAPITFPFRQRALISRSFFSTVSSDVPFGPKDTTSSGRIPFGRQGKLCDEGSTSAALDSPGPRPAKRFVIPARSLKVLFPTKIQRLKTTPGAQKLFVSWLPIFTGIVCNPMGRFYQSIRVVTAVAIVDNLRSQ